MTKENKKNLKYEKPEVKPIDTDLRVAGECSAGLSDLLGCTAGAGAGVFCNAGSGF